MKLDRDCLPNQNDAAPELPMLSRAAAFGANPIFRQTYYVFSDAK